MGFVGLLGFRCPPEQSGDAVRGRVHAAVADRPWDVQYFKEDDDFAWNFGLSLASTGSWAEARSPLLSLASILASAAASTFSAASQYAFASTATPVCVMSDLGFSVLFRCQMPLQCGISFPFDSSAVVNADPTLLCRPHRSVAPG